MTASNTRPPVEPTPEALDVQGVAAMLGVSTRHVWQLVERGLIPRPMKLGHATRWYRPAVLEALARLHDQAQGGPETAPAAVGEDGA